MFEKALAGLALLFVCIISFANVVARYTSNTSLAFTEEFSVILLVIVSLFGAAFAMKTDEHIKINVLFDKLKPQSKKYLLLVQWLCTCIVMLLIIYYGIKTTFQEYSWQSLTAGLGLPYWWYLIWLPLGAIFILFRSTQALIKYWGKK